jgi:hypothetical protein
MMLAATEKKAVADVQQKTGNSSSAAESTRPLAHDLPALVCGASEHFVSGAHVCQRHDGPDLREDFTSFEQF